MTKTQKVNFKTPRGTAKYPRLDQPYSWNEAAGRNMPDPDGQFETRIIMPEKDAQPLIKTIKDAIAAAGVKPKHLPWKPEVDKDTDEPTGNIEFTLKRYGKDTQGKPNKIAFFDSKGVMIKRDVDLTSGSVVICSGWINVSKMAARLNLKAVQVIKLIEREVEGFEAVEDDDAYVAEDDETDNNDFDNEEEAHSGRPNF
jgi:hypothetical protein